MYRVIAFGVLASATVAVVGWHYNTNNLEGKESTNDIPDDYFVYQPAPEPQLGNLSDVRYLLWTRSNSGDGDHYRLYPHNLTNLNDSPFEGTRPTHFIYHGFNDQGETGWIVRSKTELLQMYDCNVISVDWEKLVISPWYNYAVDNAYKVANYTAGLIDWLNEEKGLEPYQVHIVGHSLGSHAAGLSGKYVKSGQVGRVTGLDPAGPLFYEKDSDHRIDKSDAAFVDIIHTNSGSILEGCIALFEAVGHSDFYPNGGKHQLGCESKNDSIIEDWLDLFGGCSHARVTDLWVESIGALTSEIMFTSWPCSDFDSFVNKSCTDCGQGCLHMGFHVEQILLGNYFLRTHAQPPFARGDQQ